MELKDSFTPAEILANNFATEKLVDLIRSGDAILMVGAGCSADLYPSWNNLLQLMEDAALRINPDFEADKADPLEFADKLKECLGAERYYSFILETFKPGEQTYLPYHEALCRLPFKAITTTNYDKVLENAAAAVTKKPINPLHFEGIAKREILQFLQSLNFGKVLEKYIVHLHGIYNIPDSIILCKEEYLSKYGFEIVPNQDTLFEQLQEGNFSKEKLNRLLVQYGYEWPFRRKLLWSLLATRRIVFIGFSMSDPYFIKMLEFVKEDLSTYNAETHFLILRTSPKSLDSSRNSAEKLKSEYGIQTVFFFDEDDKYTGLSNFVSELEVKVGLAPRTITPEEKDISNLVSSAGDKELTDTLFSISKKQYNDED